MSRLPPQLARRIDRLSRRAHAFHRAAHHPLCQAYAPEVLRLGRRTLLCRGCSYAAAGGLAGALGGLALPPQQPAIVAGAAALFAAASLAALAAPAWRRGRSKLLTRLAPAAMGGATFSCGLGAHSLAAGLGALAVIAAALVATRSYRRHGPDRSPCATCPDGARPRICPGFLPLARREAAFRRLAGRWMRAEGLGPSHANAHAPRAGGARP